MPEHDVGELAGGQGADFMGEAVRDGGVDGELGSGSAGSARCHGVWSSAVRGPRWARIAAARAKVRRTVSPARPMPWASEEVIGMTPRSCSDAFGGHGARADPVSGQCLRRRAGRV